MRPDVTGICFDIQRYSIHDGPGIRTTVFLKGCPLSCTWCHNPEGLSQEVEVLIVPDRCTGCGACVDACPNPPATGRGGARVTDRAACVRCGRCVGACVHGARRMTGRTYTAQDLLDEIVRDLPFYEESGGGVTFSGGEPLMQGEFLKACLRGCRERGMHTAVDTCGYADSGLLLEVADLTDLFLFDVKLMDDARHRELTGVPLGPIVENLRALNSSGAMIWIRFPLIPGITDSRADVEEIGRLTTSLESVRVVHILPFHRTASDKYARIERTWDHSDLEPASREAIENAATILTGFGLEVRIGG
jgi:pyruvate formate lyase activating enzyme